jgi:hypothetical protein
MWIDASGTFDLASDLQLTARQSHGRDGITFVKGIELFVGVERGIFA